TAPLTKHGVVLPPSPMDAKGPGRTVVRKSDIAQRAATPWYSALNRRMNGTGLLITYARSEFVCHQSRSKGSPEHERVEALHDKREFPGALDRMGRRRTGRGPRLP